VKSAYDSGPVLGALALSLLFGGFVYALWDRLHAAMERMDWIDAFGPAAWYQRNLLALGQLGAWHTITRGGCSTVCWIAISWVCWWRSLPRRCWR